MTDESKQLVGSFFVMFDRMQDYMFNSTTD